MALWYMAVSINYLVHVLGVFTTRAYVIFPSTPRTYYLGTEGLKEGSPWGPTVLWGLGIVGPLIFGNYQIPWPEVISVWQLWALRQDSNDSWSLGVKPEAGPLQP